ncbi:unnamed protein product [Caenorhabditis nigoni]
MIRLKTKVDNFLSYSEPVDCHSETEVPSTTFRNSEIPPSQSSDGQKRVSDNMIRIKTDNDNFLSYSEPVDCHSETEVPSTTFRNSEIPPSQSSDGQKRVSDNMIRIKTDNDNFLSYSEPVDCHSETEVPSTTFRNSEIPPSQSSDGQKRVSDNMIRIKTDNDNFLSYSEPVDCHSETEVPSTTFRNSEIPPSQSSDGQKRVSDNMIRIKTDNDNFLSYSEPVDCHSETEVPSTTFRNSEIPPSQSSDGQKRVSDNMIRIKTDNDNFLSYSEPVDCHSETEVPSTTFRNSEIPPSQSSDGQKRVSDNMIRIKTDNDNFLSYSEPVDCHSETEVPSTTFRNSEIPPSQSSDGQKRVSDNMIRIKTDNDNFLSYSEPVDCHSETEVPSTTFRNSEIPPRQSSDGQKRVIICTKKMVNAETVVKKRHYNKKERAKRRKQLGLHEESEARKTKEFCQKVKERTQNMQEFLKLTGQKPEQRLLEVGNVAKIQQNNGNESAMHENPSTAMTSEDAVKDLWKEFETIGSEQSDEGLESPTYAENCEIFTNHPVSLAVIEKSVLVGPEEMIGEPEDMEEPQESQILNDIGVESPKKPTIETEHGECMDELTAPEECSAPDVFEKSLENSQESQESEKSEIMDETDGEPPMDQTVHANSFDIGIVPTLPEDTTAPESDEVTKQGDQEECGGAFEDWIKYNRELKKNQPPPEAPKTERKAKKSAKRPRIPKVTNQRQYFKKIFTKDLDSSEVEKLKKLGITLKHSDEGQMVKPDEGQIVKPDDMPENSLGNQDNVKKPKKTPNKSNAVEKIRYQFKEEDIIYGKRTNGCSNAEYKNEKRSKCLIVKIGKLEDDESMGSDVENLAGLFSKLNYQVNVVHDLTKKEIEDTVKRFGAKTNHGDSAILAFVTHGCKDGVYGTDGKVFRLDQLYELLSPENSPQLAGKPKVIFAESCRGSNRDSGYSVVEDLGEDQILERSGKGSIGEKIGEKPEKIPMNADFLFCYSTSPGHVAFAHPRFGAYHVQLLCRTIAQRAHEDDLETMMVSVRKGISEMNFKGEKASVVAQKVVLFQSGEGSEEAMRNWSGYSMKPSHFLIIFLTISF